MIDILLRWKWIYGKISTSKIKFYIDEWILLSYPEQILQKEHQLKKLKYIDPRNVWYYKFF